MRYLRVICQSLILAGVIAPTLGFASDPAALTVTATEAYLYAQQDSESKVVLTLLKGNVLKPLVQAVGNGVWYMVRTSNGTVGWIQAVDVGNTQRTEEVFRDSLKTNARDVTPEAQTEANKENNKREARESATAEARAEAARRRAAELQRARIQAEAAAEAARIRAQGEVEAAKNRKPDVCLNCKVWR